jgi:hypothetical protein
MDTMAIMAVMATIVTTAIIMRTEVVRVFVGTPSEAAAVEVGLMQARLTPPPCMRAKMRGHVVTTIASYMD